MYSILSINSSSSSETKLRTVRERIYEPQCGHVLLADALETVEVNMVDATNEAKGPTQGVKSDANMLVASIQKNSSQLTCFRIVRMCSRAGTLVT
jgi:hypothetical protein